VIPDAEKIVSDYLRGHASITPLSTRFVAHTPPEGKRDTSWVRVQELADPYTNGVAHLVEFTLQLDVYAGESGGQPEVKSIAGTVRAALEGLPGKYGTDVITGVRVNGGPRRTDPDLKHRDCKTMTISVWAHA